MRRLLESEQREAGHRGWRRIRPHVPGNDVVGENPSASNRHSRKCVLSTMAQDCGILRGQWLQRSSHACRYETILHTAHTHTGVSCRSEQAEFLHSK